MNPMHRTHVRRLTKGLILVCACWGTPTAWAVYRCEGAAGAAPTYSQWPCEGRSQEMIVSDPRTAEQQRAARQQHVTALKEARQFDRRMQREARQRLRERPTAIDGPVRQVAVGDTPDKERRRMSRSERRQERQQTLDRANRTFRAVSPKTVGER